MPELRLPSYPNPIGTAVKRFLSEGREFNPVTAEYDMPSESSLGKLIAEAIGAKETFDPNELMMQPAPIGMLRRHFIKKLEDPFVKKAIVRIIRKEKVPPKAFEKLEEFEFLPPKELGAKYIKGWEREFSKGAPPMGGFYSSPSYRGEKLGIAISKESSPAWQVRTTLHELFHYLDEAAALAKGREYPRSYMETEAIAERLRASMMPPGYGTGYARSQLPYITGEALSPEGRTRVLQGTIDILDYLKELRQPLSKAIEKARK